MTNNWTAFRAAAWVEEVPTADGRIVRPYAIPVEGEEYPVTAVDRGRLVGVVKRLERLEHQPIIWAHGMCDPDLIGSHFLSLEAKEVEWDRQQEPTITLTLTSARVMGFAAIEQGAPWPATRILPG